MGMRANNRFDKMRAFLFLLQKSNNSRSQAICNQERFANNVLIELLDASLVDISYDVFEANANRETARQQKKRLKDQIARLQKPMPSPPRPIASSSTVRMTDNQQQFILE